MTHVRLTEQSRLCLIRKIIDAEKREREGKDGVPRIEAGDIHRFKGDECIKNGVEIVDSNGDPVASIDVYRRKDGEVFIDISREQAEAVERAGGTVEGWDMERKDPKRGPPESVKREALADKIEAEIAHLDEELMELKGTNSQAIFTIRSIRDRLAAMVG